MEIASQSQVQFAIDSRRAVDHRPQTSGIDRDGVSQGSLRLRRPFQTRSVSLPEI